jgi:hypothetical protein
VIPAAIPVADQFSSLHRHFREKNIMRKKTLATFITTGALIIGLSACSGGSDSESNVDEDTSINISPTVSGDEKVDLGDINTGNDNSTDGNGDG